MPIGRYGNIMDIMGLNIKLLYLQGLWPEDPDPNIDFYLQFFSPRMAHLLMRSPRLRRTLRLIRNAYPWTMIILNSIQFFITCPVDIYFQWQVKVDVVEDAAVMVQAMFFISTLVAFLHKDKIKNWFDTMEETSRLISADEEELKQVFHSGIVQWFLHNASKYFPFPAFLFVCIGSAIHIAVELLPKRKFLVRAWYPYNATASPAYEITLTILTIQNTFMAFTLTSLLATSIFMLNFTGLYFKIINKKLSVIRETSIKIVENRKLFDLRRIVDEKSFVRTYRSNRFEECPYSQVVKDVSDIECVHGRDKRIDNLNLLQPLVELERLERRRKELSHARTYNNRATRWSDTRRNRRQDTNVTCFRRGTDVDCYSRRSQVNCQWRLDLDTEMQRQLIEFVKLHQTMLSSARGIYPIFNLQLITMFVGTILAAAGATVFVSHAPSIGIREMFLLSFISGLVSAFFLFCYLASMISLQSDLVTNAMYESDWFLASRTFKRTMLMIMCRANRSTEMTFPGLPPMSLELFSLVSIKAYKMVSSVSSLLAKEITDETRLN